MHDFNSEQAFVKAVTAPHYLLIGDGRVARHFQHYFSLLKIPFDCWHRNEAERDLRYRMTKASHILVLITDDAIEAFISQYLLQATAYLIHCSGSLTTSLAIGAHPLMTFGKSLYSLEQYQSFHFIVDADAPPASLLLPGLANKAVLLDKSAKAKYHALCVLASNFSCVLWQKFFSEFEGNLNIPAEAGYALLKQQTSNLLNDYRNALTGPLVRNDKKTLSNNINALADDPFQAVYQSFVQCYHKIKGKV